MSIPEQVGQTTRSFFDALKDQPLSLALVVVILAMAFLVYYQTSQTLAQRASMTELIVGWQRDTDKLMANCVSKEVMDSTLSNMQKITETMLASTANEIARMDKIISAEREKNFTLQQQMLEMLKPRTPTPQSFEAPKPIDYADCDPLGPFCMPI